MKTNIARPITGGEALGKEGRIKMALGALGACISEVESRIDRLADAIRSVRVDAPPEAMPVKDPPPEGNTPLERDINEHRRELERLRERIISITESVDL